MQALWNKPLLQNRLHLFSSHIVPHFSDSPNVKNASKTSLTHAMQH